VKSKSKEVTRIGAIAVGNLASAFIEGGSVSVSVSQQQRQRQ
jgi:hypothetical protein